MLADGIVKSTDGYNTFSFLPVPLVGPDTASLITTGATVPQTLLAGVTSDSLAFVVQSTDGGSTVTSSYNIAGGTRPGPITSLLDDGSGNIYASESLEEDPYFAELDPSGSQLLFGTYLGGSSTDSGNAVALDPSATSVYAVGTTFSSDYGTTAGVVQPNFGGFDNAFVAKIQLISHPSFFNGEVSDGNQLYHLTFPNQTFFGYYSDTYYPWFYHFGLGFEYVSDAGSGGVYFFDPSLDAWLYTSTVDYPYLYDFGTGHWLWYYAGTSRYFYEFGGRGLFFSPPG